MKKKLILSALMVLCFCSCIGNGYYIQYYKDGDLETETFVTFDEYSKRANELSKEGVKIYVDTY